MLDQARSIFAGTDATLRDAMAVIDAGGLGLCLLVDPEDRLVGTLSDGDVRRALLDGASLEDAALGWVERSPKTVPEGATRASAVRVMRQHSLTQVPVVAPDGRVVGIHVLQELLVPLAVPSLSDNVLLYLQECVASNFVSSVGPFVDRFEREFADFVGARHAIACTSGTAALHVALQLVGARPGTEVAVPTFTFIASVNAVSYTGAVPLLVDSEQETWNLDGQLLYDEVTRRARVGAPLPAAVEAVHILGHPAELEPLVALRDEFGIPLVEDAAESLGATYTGGAFAGRSVGTIGEIGCFSFNGNKIITTGGGGMIVTDDDELARRARHLTTQAKLPGRAYEHDEIGYNYRLSNISAAVGVAQLEDLPAFLAAKRALAARYEAGLADVGVEPPPCQPWADPTYWLYSVLVDGESSEPVLEVLNRANVQARPLWTPMHEQRPYAGAPRLGGTVAEDLFRRGISLPSSTGLEPPDQEWVIDMLREAIECPADVHGA